MKVAACFSGQARTWKKCYQNWFDQFRAMDADVDVFFHFWDYNSMPMQVWAQNTTGKSIKFDDVLLTDEEKQEIVDTLKPKSYKFEPRLKISSDFYAVKNRVAWWTVDQFNSLMKCANLKRTHEINQGFQYDLVLRMRSDLYFEKSMQLPEIIRPNTIYVTHPNWDKEWNCFRVGDIFFAADSPSYDQAACFHDHMAFIDSASVTGDPSKITYPPEVAMYYYYKSVGLTVLPAWQHVKVMRSEDYLTMKGRIDGYETI